MKCASHRLAFGTLRARFLLGALLAVSAACSGPGDQAGTPPGPRSAPPGSAVAPTTAMVPEEDIEPVAEVEAKLARNFYFVLDGSGSMSAGDCAGRLGTKIAAAVWASEQFLQSVEPGANVGLFVFDRAGDSERVPLGGDRAAFLGALRETVADGKTPLASAIRAGGAALSKQRKRQLGYGEYHLIVVTDGQATDDKPGGTLARAVREAGAAGTLISTIGFCLGRDHDLREGSYAYRTADDPEQLREALRAVTAETESYDVSSFEGL
ncbi:MAG: VWA domain-containing protein [Candidatus Schekmanbacteria bacterium]|nr:VWA domain-containing protein [Candidatus Schekmanbacteria bacterium]